MYIKIRYIPLHSPTQRVHGIRVELNNKGMEIKVHDIRVKLE